MRSLFASAAGLGKLVVLVLISDLAAVAVSAAPAWDAPKPEWRSGPIQYLLRPAEDKDYKSLKTDDDRAKAVADFWFERDPTPMTPVNEYYDEFCKRVEDANKEFIQGAGRGWHSDRGRVLLVAGYPNQRIQERDQETWIFNLTWRGADVKAGISRTVKIYFQWNSGSMEWHMDSHARELLDLFQRLDPRQSAVLSMRSGTLKSGK